MIKLDDPIAKYLPAELIQGVHVYESTDYGRQLTEQQGSVGRLVLGDKGPQFFRRRISHRE